MDYTRLVSIVNSDDKKRAGSSKRNLNCQIQAAVRIKFDSRLPDDTIQKL